MNTSLFIAYRTARGGESAQGAMAHIAAAAVAVSVATMILTLAVLFGFRGEMAALISRVASDITVTDIQSLHASECRPITDNEALRRIVGETEGVESVEAYALRGGVIRSESGMAGMVLKGVELPDGASRFADDMVAGRLPEGDGSRRKEILISQSCAELLGVEAEGRVELLFIEEEGLPRRELFKVCGIYATTLADNQASLILTDIRNVRKINGWADDAVSGYEVRTDDFRHGSAVASRINRALFEGYDGEENISAIDARQLYSYIFAWLGTHDVNAAVIITIMFVVALFNIITALLILVLERTSMIGVLKTVGMSNGGVRRIFLWRSAMTVGKGLLAGNIVGIALALIQQYTHIVTLDASGYNVAFVPIRLEAWWIAGVDAAFAIAILAVVGVATAIVSRIRPAEAIRYE